MRPQVAWLDETRGPRERGIAADDVHVDLEDVGALRVVDRQLVLGEVVAAANDPLGQVRALGSRIRFSGAPRQLMLCEAVAAAGNLLGQVQALGFRNRALGYTLLDGAGQSRMRPYTRWCAHLS